MTMHQVSDVICHVLDVLDESGEGKVVAGTPLMSSSLYFLVGFLDKVLLFPVMVRNSIVLMRLVFCLSSLLIGLLCPSENHLPCSLRFNTN
jgi:hypothetical protein